MNKALMIGALLASSWISSALGDAAKSVTYGDVSDLKVTADYLAEKARLTKEQAELEHAERKLLEARDEKEKAEMRIKTGGDVQVGRASEPRSVSQAPDADGYVTVRKDDPIDSVCVTHVGGPADKLYADVWFRGGLMKGVSAGEMIGEGVQLRSIHAGDDRGWGIAVATRRDSKFVTMCDMRTARVRGVPERKKAF